MMELYVKIRTFLKLKMLLNRLSLRLIFAQPLHFFSQSSLLWWCWKNSISYEMVVVWEAYVNIDFVQIELESHDFDFLRSFVLLSFFSDFFIRFSSCSESELLTNFFSLIFSLFWLFFWHAIHMHSSRDIRFIIIWYDWLITISFWELKNHSLDHINVLLRYRSISNKII